MAVQIVPLENGYFYVVARLADSGQEKYLGWFVDFNTAEISWCELARNASWEVKRAERVPSELQIEEVNELCALKK